MPTTDALSNQPVAFEVNFGSGLPSVSVKIKPPTSAMGGVICGRQHIEASARKRMVRKFNCLFIAFVLLITGAKVWLF